MHFTKSIRSLAVAAALAVPLATLPLAQANAEPVVISVGIAPPVLPVYVQPPVPGDGYIWTPGYWAYGDEGYYWVPGVWVLAPQPGYLWTPAYWGWEGGAYIFHGGYWGPHVGFYGGINYGFGYGGVGFEGGYWGGGHFFYNTAVVRFGGGFHPAYVYSHPFVPMNHSTVAFNGGAGGIQARPSPQEMAAMHENHLQPTGEQMSHQNFAAQNRSQLASVNHGRPGVAAAPTPAAFHSNPTGGVHPAGGGEPMGHAQPGGERAGAPAASAHAPAPASRPESPAAQAHPAEQPHPAAQPHPQAQSHPAPQQHSAPAPKPQSHPAPAREEKR